MSELRSSFERDGYVIVTQVFEPDRCEEMIQEICRLLPHRFSIQDRKTWTGKVQDCCNNLPLYQRNGLLRYKDREGFRRNPVFDRHVYSNPRIRKLFHGITGRSPGRIHIRGLHPIFPMPRWISINEAIGNRIDPQIDRPERPWLKIPRPPQLPIPGHLDAHPMDVGMMVYLDKVSGRGGGLSVWPGSHQLLLLCFKSLHEFFPTSAYKRCMNFLQRFRPIEIAGEKGDVLIFHNRLLHSNTPNRTRRIRYAVLLDVFGKDWEEQDRLWKRNATMKRRRAEFAAGKGFAAVPMARETARRLRFSPTRAFWSSHPRLTRWVSGIAKDPLGTARREISSKIRRRRVGDCWIVVSQDPVHRLSPKLDAYGTAALGAFRVALNGVSVATSVNGVIVECIELRETGNSIEICGAFDVDHYVRIVQSKNPLDKSEILYSEIISANPGETLHRISVALKSAASIEAVA